MFASRLVLCLLVLLVSNVPVTAQKKKFCPVPPPSPFKHNGQIVTTFDPSARGMRTTLAHPRTLGKGPEAVYFSASYVHADPRRSGAQQTVEVAFMAVSPSPRFRDSHDLVLYVDGKPRSFAGATRYQARPDIGGVMEAASVKLSVEELQAVTRARKVEAKLGPAQLELSNNHLEALRELSSLIAPAPGRWRADE